MSSKKSGRRGLYTKTTKRHATAIPAARDLLRVLNKCPEVTKIACGVIKPGLRSAQIRVKVAVLNPKTLRVTVRGRNAVQELKAYTTDLAKTEKTVLEWSARD